MNQPEQLAVHLVGSVPLADTESVFKTVASSVGQCLHSIPDGETGERSGWIRHLQAKLADHPALEIDPNYDPFEFRQWDGQLVRAIPWRRLKAGSDPDSVSFDTGYAECAIDSFEIFKRLQADHVIGDDVRFQVSLPTPMAISYQYISPPHRTEFLRCYARSMNRELDKIFDAIDAQRLTIQWDVCQEVLVFENYYPERGPTYKADIFAELGRLGNAIPDAANLGFHLCYGSPRDEHMVQPVDMAVLVEIAHGILGSVDRAVQFIHMPVPKDRTDENYYQPLRNLKRPDETALFLGLVHHGDETGNRTRLARAQSVTTVQGISAECGWGRTDPERVPGLLQAHRQLAG